ncbi:hypothetical protein GCM10010466_46390 [Planomonospora alba]|uniref:MFS transporter n=1 Tax=Planomonospora alba TaxID=161354 RepID=A0ABP6NJ94_9ACTN
MYSGSALAFTGAGMGAVSAAWTALPSGEQAAGTSGAVLPAAVDAARALLMVTGAGFGIFLLVMTALLAAGAVLRGADAVRRRRALPAARHAAVTPDGTRAGAEALR